MKLILSIIALSDKKGYLPVSFEIQNYFSNYPQIIKNKNIESIIKPEDIYSLFTDLDKLKINYFPKEIPLYIYTEPGVWLWTSANSKKISFKNKKNKSKKSFFKLLKSNFHVSKLR